MNHSCSAMLRRFTALFLLTFGGLCAQTATDTNLGSRLTVDSSTLPATYTFSWWGTTGYHYLVMSSPDLITWNFLPNFNPSGAGAVLSIQFATDAKKYFFRTLQFDPNDVPASIDTDGDGLPDKWELYYFGDLSRNGAGDWNNDGVLDRDAFRFGLDPKGGDQSQVTGQADAFNYDARGWLNGVTLTGGTARTLVLDNEGNINGSN